MHPAAVRGAVDGGPSRLAPAVSPLLAHGLNFHLPPLHSSPIPVSYSPTMTKPWLRLSIVVGFCFMLASPVLADYQAGVDAYKRGDYDTVLKEWRPLAEQGNASAQSNLGVMYDKGQGVSQDYQEAVRWYRLAAEQGHAKAQYNLGVMYRLGQGVPKDYALAHMWMNLAAAKRVKKAGKGRDLLEILMTPAQLAEAQRLAREWKAKGK